MKLFHLLPLAILAGLALGCDDDDPEIIDLCRDREFQSVGPYEICTHPNQCMYPLECSGNVCVQPCPGGSDEECDLGSSGFCSNVRQCEYACEDYPAGALAESDCHPVQHTGGLRPRMCEACGPAYCPWYE